MSSEIQWIQLRELSIRITKGTTPTKGEGFVSSGINYIKSESITSDGLIDKSKFAFIDIQTHEKLRRSQLQAGNILFSMAGVYLGKTAVVLPEHLPANTNQAVGIISLDESKADPYFIHYSLQTPSCRAWVLNSAAQSAQPNFNLQEIGNLKVPHFELTRQKEIASVMRALDDRITLLRETNTTLEAIAQALFKSWFVEFDPVHAKQQGRAPEGMDAQTAALFPDSFEASELGMVPKGWRVGKIADICSTISNGSTPSRSKAVFWENGSIPWFKTGELSDGFLINSSEFITHEALSGSSVKIFPKFAVLMAIYAAPTVGRLGILTEEATFNQACTGMVAKENIGPWFLFWTLFNGRDWFNSRANGAAQQNISKAIVAAYELVIPNQPALDAFNRVVSALHESILLNSEKVSTLSKLRDTLLPRLISGQLRLPEAQALVEEAVDA